jgi:IS30 family transposase
MLSAAKARPPPGRDRAAARAPSRALGVRFYFATPHHAWERGTSENTNGLVRQDVPKGTSMAGLRRLDCAVIAAALNTRPRKRLDYRTPQECFDAY